MGAWLSAWRQTARLCTAHWKLWLPFLSVLFVEVLLLGVVWLAPHPPFAELLAPPIRFFFGDRVLHYPAHLWFLYHATKHAHLVASFGVGAFMTGVACAMIRQIHQQHPPMLRDVLVQRQVPYGRVVLVWAVVWALASGAVTLSVRFIPNPWARLGAAAAIGVLTQALFAYAIPAVVFESVGWWKSLWRAVRETLRYPLSTGAVTLIPSLALIGLSIAVPPARVAQWMAATAPEIAVLCVVARLLIVTMVDATMNVALAHLWWLHRLPAPMPVCAKPARLPTAGSRAPSLAKPLTTAVVVAIVGMSVCGCSVNYNGERLFWKAQQFSAKLLARAADGKSAAPEVAKETTPEQLAQATSAYELVIRKAPGTIWAARSQLAIGSLQALQKQYDKARESYRLVLQNYNQHRDYGLGARLAIAKTYEVEQKWDEAIKTYREIADYHPWSIVGMEAPLYIARIHELRNEAKEAKRAYGWAMRTYTLMLPDAPTPVLATQLKGYLALVYQRLGAWDQVVPLLNELAMLTEGVNRPLILLTLASIYSTKLRDDKLAGEWYTTLAQEFPQHPFSAVARAHLERLGLPVPQAPESTTAKNTAAAVAPAVPAAAGTGR